MYPPLLAYGTSFSIIFSSLFHHFPKSLAINSCSRRLSLSCSTARPPRTISHARRDPQLCIRLVRWIVRKRQCLKNQSFPLMLHMSSRWTHRKTSEYEKCNTVYPKPPNIPQRSWRFYSACLGDRNRLDVCLVVTRNSGFSKQTNIIK